MTPILVIAGLTIKEAVRRKVVIAAALIGFVVAAVGFIPFPPPTPTLFLPDVHAAMVFRSQTVAWIGCGMIKFFSSVLAVSLAAGAITSEIERGVLSTIAPKPIARWKIYIGKWIGLIAMLACMLFVWGALLSFDIWHQTHIYRPRVLLGLLATGLFPLLFATLTLCFSSVAGFALSAGVALIAAGCALAEDIIALLATMLSVPALTTVSKIVGCIVPLSRMNHWITRGLGDAGHDLFQMGMAPSQAASYGDLAYVVLYIVGFLIAGAIVFQKRDL